MNNNEQLVYNLAHHNCPHDLTLENSKAQGPTSRLLRIGPKSWSATSESFA